MAWRANSARTHGNMLNLTDVKNVHKKVLSFVSSSRFGNNPFIRRMFQPLGQNQAFTVHARQMMHMLFETCAREELNKLELYVHAAGGKRFKFEDNPSFFAAPPSQLSKFCLLWKNVLAGLAPLPWIGGLQIQKWNVPKWQHSFHVKHAVFDVVCFCIGASTQQHLTPATTLKHQTTIFKADGRM